MNYYVFKLRWSQTDDEEVIVKANTQEEAKQKLANCNARYITGGWRPARMIT